MKSYYFWYVSKDEQIERLRNDTIVNIAAYVKANPRARPQDLQKKVEEEIELFKAKINALWCKKLLLTLKKLHVQTVFFFQKPFNNKKQRKYSNWFSWWQGGSDWIIMFTKAKIMSMIG